ncbi:hypothetical protein TNCV_2507641 [Trichonephila clavipes]|nr:hypothetical protein TNCV_2507641 [Trichonephila clavipes]
MAPRCLKCGQNHRTPNCPKIDYKHHTALTATPTDPGRQTASVVNFPSRNQKRTKIQPPRKGIKFPSIIDLSLQTYFHSTSKMNFDTSMTPIQLESPIALADTGASSGRSDGTPTGPNYRR